MNFQNFLEENGFVVDQADYEDSWVKNFVWGTPDGCGFFTSKNPFEPVSYVWAGDIPAIAESFTREDDGWLYQKFEQVDAGDVDGIMINNNGPIFETLIPA